MSSEYSIHLHDGSIEGKVYPLSLGETAMVTLDIDDPTSSVFKLFVPAARGYEVAQVLFKVAGELSILHDEFRTRESKKGGQS